MKRLVGAIILVLPSIGAAEDAWMPLGGAGIRTALEGRTLVYATASQDFRASGRTLYNAGRDSWGYWRVEGDKYCSQWPPSDLWTCYDMAQRGATLRFTGDAGDHVEATYGD